MTIATDSPSILGHRGSQASTRDVIEEPKPGELPRFAERPGFLTQTNQHDESQTYEIHVNGSSDKRYLDLGRFLASVPPVAAPSVFSRTLQKWQGIVTRFGDDAFWARLAPIVGGGPEQDAEIYVDEVDPDDRPLIEAGAVFYWSIGYLDRPSGRQRVSLLRFRRLPTWTASEIRRAEAEAARLRRVLLGAD